MQYSLTLPIGGECSDPRILADLAALAEAAGWDGVFLEDYQNQDPSSPVFQPEDEGSSISRVALAQVLCYT